jgi:hypothetical protein
VFGGLNRLLAAATVTGAAIAAGLAGPSTALAASCNGGPSAVNVYTECQQTGGGGKSAGGGGSKPSTSGPKGTSVTPTPTVSSHAAKAIKHAGKDRHLLAHLIHTTAPQRLPQQIGPSGTGGTPTALGSAFDLGSGPTVLLIALVGTAFLLLAATGVRGWRRSHRG